MTGVRETRETVWLVPHTHWDREWYEPFQRFRLRLVDLMDDVIARAEADPSFRFTLDGQLAVVDDYLEVRPEAAARMAALVQSGQFAIGPWAILLDEFLCSGENIVRNLEWGLRRAADLGEPMPVGYLPDMFGHCAQMPQILALAGLRQACVWRGVPAAIDTHAFAWEAPDGTRLRTEYLPGGYGNAAELLADPDRLAEAAAEHVVRARPWFGADPILAMYGTDHSAPLPWLSSAVASLDGDVHLRLSTLAEYLAGFDPSDIDGLPSWRGELRSHARANILPGVISNRPHLKSGLGAAERMVERYAEPLAALWQPAEAWPARLLELAWQRLVQCSCHDSVTGCGVDETAVQVAARIAEAEQIGRGVRDRALDHLAAAVPGNAAVVVNPTPTPRTGIVRLDLPAAPEWPQVALALPDGSVAPVQEITRNDDGALFETVRPAGWIAAGLRKGWLGLDFLARAVQRVAITGERELTVTMGRVGPGFTAADRALAPRVEAACGDWRMRVVEEPLRAAYAAVPVPALGWTSVRAVPQVAPAVAGAVRVAERRLANDLLSIEVAGDGTLTLSTPDGVVVSGVGRLVDGDDIGDLYNYAPPEDDRLLDTPDTVRVSVCERGPLVGALEVRRGYPWRERTEVVMRVELRAGEPFCRLELAFTNRHPDHRVRLHVPLAEPATRSYAEGQFAVVARGLASEGGHGEEPIPTFPAYSFVDAGGVAVLLDQVSEYEVVDDGRELAVTLLRATGLISRAEHPLRAEPAGPVIATPQAQLIGAEVRTRLAVLPHRGTWAEADVAAAAEAFRCPLTAVRGRAAGDGPLAAAEGLAVEGDGVVFSSLRRRSGGADDWLELRVVAMTDAPTAARIGPVTAARRADLLGNPGAALAVDGDQVTVPLRPWEIATLQVRRDAVSDHGTA
ncbi:MAG: glycoside hydrolase family 38 C-terminal domain-containing protein [Micromonosporaceae bacterium]